MLVYDWKNACLLVARAGSSTARDTLRFIGDNAAHSDPLLIFDRCHEPSGCLLPQFTHCQSRSFSRFGWYEKRCVVATPSGLETEGDMPQSSKARVAQWQIARAPFLAATRAFKSGWSRRANLEILRVTHIHARIGAVPRS